MTEPTSDLSTLYADSDGQTAEMHPPGIIDEAKAMSCVDHDELEVGFTTGVGYAGGGFGQYKRCGMCRRVYSKTALKDGNNV